MRNPSVLVGRDDSLSLVLVGRAVGREGGPSNSEHHLKCSKTASQTHVYWWGREDTNRC